MTHDIEQIRSLMKFIECTDCTKESYDGILTRWMKETGNAVRDPDAIDYYLQLIPLIERRLHAYVISI